MQICMYSSLAAVKNIQADTAFNTLTKISIQSNLTAVKKIVAVTAINTAKISVF